MFTLHLKLKQMMSKKISTKTTARLILVNIQKIKFFLTKQTKKVLVKGKDDTKAVPVVDFIGLKINIYLCITEDDKSIM